MPSGSENDTDIIINDESIDANQKNPTPQIQKKSNRSEQQTKRLTEITKTTRSNINSNKASWIIGEKTVFTKISEQMYNNLISNPSNPNIFDYTSWVDDTEWEKTIRKYTSTKTEKDSRFTSFVDRLDQKSRRKKLGIEMVSIENNEKRRVDSASSHKQSKGKNRPLSMKNQKFMNFQYTNKQHKENFITELKEKLENEEKKELTFKPKICKKSEYIVEKKAKITLTNNVNDGKGKGKSPNKTQTVFDKLHDGNNKQDKERALKEASTTPNKANKKWTKKDVDNWSTKLFKDAETRSQAKETNTLLYMKQFHRTDFACETTEMILIQQFLRNYEIEIHNLLNKQCEDNEGITYQNLVKLLFKLGFTIKDYSNIEEASNWVNTEKEYQLIKDAWKVLTRHKGTISTDQESIESNFVILFLLSVLGWYQGKQASQKVIRKQIPYIDQAKYKYDEALVKHIKKFFRLFCDNQMCYMKKDQILSRNGSNSKEKCDKLFSFSPQRNESSMRRVEGKTRISIINKCNLFNKKRENSLIHNANKKREAELKQCTFYPNNKRPSKGISNIVTKRWYNIKSISIVDHLKETDEKCGNWNWFNTDKSLGCPYNCNIFAVNPLQDDVYVSKKVSQYHKARENNKKNPDSKSRYFGSFHWDNEKQSYKDTFDRFDTTKSKSRTKHIANHLRFVFEIKVEDTIKCWRIYKGEDIMKIINKFCTDNNWDCEAKDQIVTAVTEKVNNRE